MNASFGLKDLRKIIKNIKAFEKRPNISLIKKAFFFARKKHDGQLRASKEPYFIHPLQTAVILSEMNADSETIAAGFLHDVVEDSDVSLQEIRKIFGKDVACLVDGVTKVNIISRKRRADAQIASLQKTLLATVSDVRVLVIKLADKLHNLRTIKFLPLRKQREIANYALEVYVPLAHKLGMHKILTELEDRSFAVIEPHEYSLLKKEIEVRRKKTVSEEKELIKIFLSAAKKQKKSVSIYTSNKGVYAVFTKIASDGKSLEEIYDFAVVIILTNSVKDCYDCLGLVHTLFPPVAKKLKDYIAIPQSNSYKSIHTTVVGPRGHPVKIYIRTKEMDDIAKNGVIVAKKFDEQSFTVFNKKLAWMRRSLADDFSPSAGKNFLESLKTDFLDKTVFFFDNHGKIHELANGSTPIDFAFHLGKEKGLCFKKASINGRVVPPWYELQSGDIVDVCFSKKYCVGSQWLSFVKSKTALKEIQRFLKKKPSKENGSLSRTRVKIAAADRIGLAFTIMKVFKDQQVNIDSISSVTSLEKKAFFDITADFVDKQQAEKLKKKLSSTKGIFSVQFY